MSLVDVIVPVYKPDEKLDKLIGMLGRQTVRPDNIFLMVTLSGDESVDDELIRKLVRLEKVTVTTLPKRVFDYGATRNKGVSFSDAEFILFMTQDAVPEDEYLVQKLLSAFDDTKVASAYARQIADVRTNPIESFTRLFNYPKQSCIKSKEDIPTLGIKTYFCSNVCAMYRRSVFDELGGFTCHVILNEDSIFAASVIEAGYTIAYVADAKVNHSHMYTNMQYLRRNFDIAVSHRQFNKVFDAVPSESEGIRLVKTTAVNLIKTGRWRVLPELVLKSGFKYAGYFLGKRYRHLPKPLVISLSMNKAYWKKGFKDEND